MAAISNSIDWSLAAAGITSTTRKPLQFPPHITNQITKNPFPFISLLFFTSNPPSATSACSSSPAVENDAALIDLSLNFNSPQNSKQLNTLICTLFKDPQTEHLAHDSYQKAKQNPDFRPERYTLKLLIRYLTRSNNWTSLFSFSQDLSHFRVLPDRPTCCRLITVCMKSRKFKLVDNLLEAFVSNDVVTAVLAFDAAMKGYNKLHMYSSTIVLYQRMKSHGLDLDPPCYYTVMEAYLKMGQHQNAIDMFQDFENRKFIEKTPFNYSKIYWILCEALGKTGRPVEALDYFRQMTKKGIPEDHSLYSSLISSFASSGKLEMAEELFKEAESKKMVKDPALFLKLVLRYVEEGLMEKTLDIVASMKQANIRVSDCIFCAIINGFSKKRGAKAAIKVYEELISQGCEPGQVTYASALSMYCRLGLYSKGETIFSEMEKKGFNKCVVAYSTMISAYAKTGKTKEANRLVAKMKERGCEPNVWIYNSVLDMNGRAMNLRMVEKTWKEMKRRKILPDRVSYTSVISGYNRAKEFDKCVSYYKEFKMTGGKIDRALAGIMVAIFSKTNRVDELVELLQDVKMEGTVLDARFYGSAMSALRDAGLQTGWLQEMFKYS